MAQYIVLGLGAVFAIIGIVLFVKRVGGEGQAAVNLPGGVGVSGVAPGLLVFVVGCGLVFTATTMGGPVFNDDEPADEAAETAGGGPEASSARGAGAGAEEEERRIEIDPPTEHTLGADDVRREEGAGGDELWTFTLGGTSKGLAGDAPRRVSLLYRRAGTSDPWFVEGSGPLATNGGWKAEGWVDFSAFGAKGEHDFEVRALAGPEELEQGSRVDPDFKRVRAPGAKDSDPGRPLTYDALSDPIKLKMLKPE